MNKLKIGLGMVVVALAMIIVSNTNKNTDAVKPIVKIGISGPLSGSLAFAGEGLRNGAEMAIAEFEKNNPNGKNKYQVVYEDDGFDPKRAASAVVKLANVDKVDAFMTFASAAGNIATPIAEKNQLVHIGIASDPNILKGDYNFIHWTPPFEEAKLFLQELKKRNIKKIALMGANIQGITAVMDEVERQAQGTEIQIVAKEVFNFGTTDFRTIISKVRALNPEIYVPIAFSPELEILAKQIKDAGIKEPMTSLEGFELTDKPELFEGLWYVNSADASERAPKNGQKPTRAQIKDALYDLDIEGALGRLTIDKDGFVLSKAVVRIIENGKPKTIK